MKRKAHLNSCLRFIFFTFCCLMIYVQAFSNPLIGKYDLQYRIDFEESKLFSKAELSLMDLQRGDTLNLLLYRLLKVKSIKDDSGNDIKFTQNVVSFIDWEALQVNHIVVVIGEPALYKRLIIEYGGYILGYSETGMEYVKDNISPGFTILRTDCFAYPVQGVPYWEKNRAGGLSYFDYTISVTVPDSLTVINGGVLMSKETGNGSAEYVYQNSKPAWRIDAAIARYSTLTESGFKVHYFPEDSAGARTVLESLRKVYSLYKNWFGEVSFSGYSIIEIPDGWGSQADVTCILQTASAFKDENLLYELYHEISHVWNIPSGDKNPCRLESEGLAMFLQYLAMEKLNDKTGLLDSSAAKIFRKLKKKFETDSTVSNTPIIDYGKKQLTDLSYTKGMLFYYLLYKMVGENMFMKTIKDYYSSYRSKQARTEEFSDFLIEKINNPKVEFLVNDWIMTDISSQSILKAQSVENLFY